ncbi:hypothetical protein [Pseudanabaena sp. 'Roaring Creek']
MFSSWRKPKSRYVCNNCGEDFPQICGKCPACSSWGNLARGINSCHL